MIYLLSGNLHLSAGNTQIFIISYELFPKLQILSCQVPDRCLPSGDLQPPLTYSNRTPNHLLLSPNDNANIYKELTAGLGTMAVNAIILLVLTRTLN